MTALRRPLVAAVSLLAAAVTIPPESTAHSGGRAVPVASIDVRQSGPLQALVEVRVRDEDGGEAVRNAEISGFGLMTRPHTMYTHFGPLPEAAPGSYRAVVQLPMPARWTLELTIEGRDVVARKVQAPVVIEPASAGGRSGRAAAPVVVGTIQYALTRRELLDMVVLWTHGAAATAWIVGLALLLLATTAGAGIFAAETRRRIGRWYRRRGFVVLWLAAALVVATGAYNTLRVTPFELVWRPRRLDELERIPYGRLYEGILLTKLLLFGIMLVSGAIVARRARRGWDESPADQAIPALVLRRLGTSGIVFLLAAPFIVAAAVALRYVHILSHVAASSGG